jgi:cytochrome b561
MPPAQKYTEIAVLLHWFIALLIIANIALGLGAGYVPDSYVRPMIDLHKSIGITVLALAFIRFFWRFNHTPPPLPAEYPPWERALAQTAHVLLYVLIFALPITGWIHDSAWDQAAAHPMQLFWVIPWFRLGFITGLDPLCRARAAHPWRAETSAGRQASRIAADVALKGATLPQEFAALPLRRL